MKVSKEGLELIKKWEGLRLTAYPCPAGIWSIGYGHTSAAGPPVVSEGMSISEADAEKILASDLERYEGRVTKAFRGADVPQSVFDAAVSFDYNTGAVSRASWVDSFLARRDAAEIERLFCAYRRAGGKVLKGLVARRKDEFAHMRGDLIRFLSAPAPLPPRKPTPFVESPDCVRRKRSILSIIIDFLLSLFKGKKS